MLAKEGAAQLPKVPIDVIAQLSDLSIELTKLRRRIVRSFQKSVAQAASSRPQLAARIGQCNPPGDAAGGKCHPRLWFRERDEAPADSHRQHEVAS
ncbi:hypothetical protein AS026_31100 [Rhizobium altiplani]|uniref:Uncharacterized protein n=1 Tax=Rhizobium altiplani TaxID=1864509 RepID=A0A109JYA5_9HYPH|nr:hypothetical protein AS026_31160 [Rhizobium altiplani]KWV57288.1 hypothetical protein AS026_31135 [Rhizobium altiplani]KWV57485.1 hypothetical protein AS026_31100 [Rhizobium altiplani]